MKMNWQSAAGAAPPAVHLGGPFFTISSMSLLSRFSALFLHFVSNNTTNLIHNINSNWNGHHPNRLMYHIFGFFISKMNDEHGWLNSAARVSIASVGRSGCLSPPLQSSFGCRYCPPWNRAHLSITQRQATKNPTHPPIGNVQ